jgi:hypothetical protein
MEHATKACSGNRGPLFLETRPGSPARVKPAAGHAAADIQRARVWLEGRVRGANGVQTGAGITVTVTETVGLLSLATSDHWRVRVLYEVTGAPLQRHSRWFTASWNGPNEEDLRTARPGGHWQLPGHGSS